MDEAGGTISHAMVTAAPILEDLELSMHDYSLRPTSKQSDGLTESMQVMGYGVD